MELDPRSVANLIISEAFRRNIRITNLSLQKILFFVHGRFLLEQGEPLLSGSFEAWQYGPVSLPVYESFKHFGALPIETFAERRDIRSGTKDVVPIPTDPDICQKVVDLAVPYLSLSAGRLVELSHARGSPWDIATSGDFGGRVYGLRITNQSIEANFRRHKVSISTLPRLGEPDEESPPN